MTVYPPWVAVPGWAVTWARAGAAPTSSRPPATVATAAPRPRFLIISEVSPGDVRARRGHRRHAGGMRGIRGRIRTGGPRRSRVDVTARAVCPTTPLAGTGSV